MEDEAYDSLREQLARLERQLEWLQGQVLRPRVELRAERPWAFLGQSLLLRGRVTDPVDGEGLADRPVTLTTTLGSLRLGDGYDFRQGQVVGARTDAFGQLQVTLLPPSAEVLEQRHLDALNAQFARLESEPASLEQLQAMVDQLARAYDWESAAAFREAVDRLFSETAAAEAPSATLAVPVAWPKLELAVMLHVHGEHGVVSADLLHFEYRHWLGLLLAGLQRLRAQTGDLLGKLRHQTRIRRTGDLLGACQNQVDRFVAETRGRIGQIAARRQAESALDSFVRDDLGRFSPEVRLKLDRGLRATGAVLAGRGTPALAGLDGLRHELRGELVQQMESLDIAKVRGLSDSLGQLGKEVDQVAAASAKKLDPEALVILRHAMRANLLELTKRVPNFSEQLPELLAPRSDSQFVPLRELDLNLGGRTLEIRKPIVAPETPIKPIVVKPIVLGPVIKPKKDPT